MAQEDDRKHEQPTDAPSPAGGDNRPQDGDEPIIEGIDDDFGAIIIAPARRPMSASGGPESRVLSREEWLKALGPRFEDLTDAAVEKGLAFVILGGPAPARRTPKKPGRKASPRGTR